MKFKEALTQIINIDYADERIGDAFYLYSRLSDLCTSYEDRDKVSMFYAIDKRLHIVKGIQTEGKTAVLVLKAAYPTVKEILSRESYVRLIDCVSNIFFPPPVVETSNIPPKSTPKPVVQKAVVQRAVEEEAPEPKTPLTSSSSAGMSGWKIILIAVAIVLALAAGITCLIVFRKSISWKGWQYVIGVIGGLFLLLISGFICFIIEDFMSLEIFQLYTFFALTIAVANFVLYSVFRVDYKIIFIFITAYFLIGLLFSCISAFDTCEVAWGIVQIVEGVIIIAGLILGLIFL